MNRCVLLATMLACWGAAWAQSAAELSEKDFLSDLPVVLSVSRLPQRLDDTPGAVTVIERDMIRLSGARDVADLMRLVPGFQTSMAFERSAPQASYHGGFGSYSNRIQVLVDGRSTYSPYFIGAVEPGLQTVALEDIERIEVLRGSNSAAYGARAFLGVINIVTRDPMDTQGTALSLTEGGNGIRDARASLGWGTDKTAFRLGLDRRGDAGLADSNGHNRVDRFNFRADLRPNASDEIQLRAGSLAINAGKGFADNPDDLSRDTRYASGYLQLDWRRSLHQDQDLSLSYSHMQESYQDSYPYSLTPLGINDSIAVSGNGVASNDTLTLQQSWRQGSKVRAVWGAELRRERITSRPLYNTDAALITDFSRFFGNLEWRPIDSITLNAGAMAERSSASGNTLAPRLMLNWHLAEGQTLRAGVSRAYRPPSTYEQFADVRYFWNGHLLEVNTLSSGKVQAESIVAKELGYLGVFPAWRLNLDVRVFHEDIGGPINQLNATRPKDYANGDGYSLHGLEYQLKWQPWHGAQFMFSQAFIRNSMANGDRLSDTGLALTAPRLANTLAYFQKLPGGLDLSLLHQDSGTVTPQGAGRFDQVAMTRTDLRLAAPLRLSDRPAELALVLQNLGSSYVDFAPPFMFQRRAYLTLRINN